ncbi:three-Cys-motif partner protein TcmP [Desulfococcaceae bacterium HSG7]|nr:three-Cys-motif partner protein TcmP [Desulfococcaceae bacterium HSG7]
MGYKDLHNKPFDESTIFKLGIFEDYAQAWIPTFVMQPHISEIHIFDFFAGTGYDKNGIQGSPIRILEKLKEHQENLFQRKVNVIVHFNEFEPKKKEQNKFDKLKSSCSEFINKNKNLKNRIAIKYYNEDFETLFSKLLPIINKNPSLVYLDQNGIKFLSEKYFLELEKTKQTDFLYFVSSSYFWRFGENKEFKSHIDIDMTEAKKHHYKLIHRNITEQIRKKLPINTNLKLYPFSIKKGANIHGIIFGASHPIAVDKFLSIGWKRNGINGDANFDIDEDSKKPQLYLFENKKLTKIENFQKNVKKLILQNEINNNFKLLEYVYSEGHIPKHAAECLKNLKKEGVITYKGRSPLITYDNVFKKKKYMYYEVVKK